MLESLNKIDWKNLEHAYGEASDVPQLIRDLASKDPDLRDHAFYELYGNIYHQGTRYQATPYAIPFIFELIQEPDVPEKADLIRFTIDLALGYPESYLPKGPNIEHWVLKVDQLKEEAKSEDSEDKDGDWLKHIDSFIDSYKVVLKEISTYYKCLESNDIDIKIMAIYAIAWFREEAKSSIPKIRNLIKKETGEKILANSLICLSMLDSYLEDKTDEQIFRKYFSENDSLLVKMSASIALMNILEEEIDIGPINYILKEIPNIVELTLSPYEFPWNDGELLGFVSEIIKYSAVHAPEKVIPDLTEIFAKVKGIKAFNVMYSLLWIVFPEFPDQGGWTLKILNKYQKMVLKALADNSRLWEDKDIEPTGFIELLREYKLPTTQAGLRRLLKIKS